MLHLGDFNTGQEKLGPNVPWNLESGAPVRLITVFLLQKSVHMCVHPPPNPHTYRLLRFGLNQLALELCTHFQSFARFQFCKEAPFT